MDFDPDDKFEHPIPRQPAPTRYPFEWYEGLSEGGRRFIENMSILMIGITYGLTILGIPMILWLMSGSGYEIQAVEITVERGDTLFPGQTVLVPHGNWHSAQERHDARGTILTVSLNERPPNY